MVMLKCKMCGGDVELAEDKTFGTCEYCGSTMTFPKVGDELRAAAFNRGNHFRRIGEFDKALAVYERIIREDECDAEAHWCCALCRFGIEYVEDPATYEWVPTCHRASFDSFLEDVDYLAAVEHSEGITRRQYQKDAARIAEVQRGILATSQNAEPFDVFICYKESDESGGRTKDSMLAQEVYYQLTEQGRKVFFSRITLEDVVGSQYEPYIFAALNSAKVMIVVGTKPEYLNAVWVKNEWSRFLAIMKKDHHKVLLPCYRDMDPYDLPEQLSVLQSYDMGKIGFIQDLIRGVSKVLDAEKKFAPTPETVIMQQSSNANTLALLKRGTIALEDGEWDKADSFFEEVLNQDPECAQAYLGKVLAEEKLATLDDLVNSHLSRTEQAEQVLVRLLTESSSLLQDNHSYVDHVKEMVNRYELGYYLSAKEIEALYYDSQPTCISEVDSRQSQLDEEEAYWSKNRALSRALRYDTQGEISSAKERVLGVMRQRLADATEAVAKASADLDLIVEQTRRSKDAEMLEKYEKAAAKRNNELKYFYDKGREILSKASTVHDYRSAASLFRQASGYADSVEKEGLCLRSEKRFAEEKSRREKLVRELAALRGELASMGFFSNPRRKAELETKIRQIENRLNGIK